MSPLDYLDVTSREDLLREIDRRWHELDVFVRGLSPAELRLPVDGGEEGITWDVGVAIAHIALWKRNAAKVATMMQGPATPDDRYPPFVLGLDLNAVNDEAASTWAARPRDQVLAEHESAHEDLLQAIATLDESRLIVNGKPIRWLHPMLQHATFHFAEHIRKPVEAHRAARAEH